MLLSTSHINPRLLKCSYFNGYECLPGIKMASRICYDYELEYYLKSDGGIIVDNVYIPFKAGEINIRKPGQVVCGVAPYECYIICLDIKGSAIVPSEYAFGSALNAQPLYQNALLSLLPNKLIPTRAEYVNSLINEIYRTSQNESELACLKINSILYELLYDIISQCHLKNAKPNLVDNHIQHAVEYINSNFCEELCVKDMVKYSGLSKAYFHRCFKEYTKTTPLAMVTSLRIEKAKNLLCITDNSISEISTLCGFYDNVYFSHIFKKATGLTPSQYRGQYMLT